MRKWDKYVVALDLDDFCPSRDPDYGGLMEKGTFRYLNILWERFPNMKVTLFTIPNLHGKHPITMSPKWCSWVRSLVATGKVEVALHGYEHTYCELLHLSQDDIKERILRGEALLEEANIPFVKGFKAPYWAISDNVYRALASLGYDWIMIHPESFPVYPEAPIKYPHFRYVQEWYSLGGNLPLDKEVLVIHGHMREEGVTNGLSRVNCAYTEIQLHRLTQYADIDFRFLSEIAMDNSIREEGMMAEHIRAQVNHLYEEDKKMEGYINSLPSSALEMPQGWSWWWEGVRASYKRRGILASVIKIVRFLARKYKRSSKHDAH